MCKDHKPKRIACSFNDKYIEYKSEGNEKLSMEQYLKLNNVTDNLKAPGEWKIHLTMKINFMSSKDTDEH